jgi:prepilin-type processing-associated H-X9-DG protein
MAQIDVLLARLQENGGSRAIIQGDAPVQLELPAGVSQGAALSNERIEEILREIAPADVADTLDQLGQATFVYNSPQGAYRFAATRSGGVTRLEIQPTAVAAPPLSFDKAEAPSSAPSTPPTPPPDALDPTASVASPPVAPVPPNYSPSAVPPNDSGQPNAVLPPELRGFSWGGLLMSWIWAIGNGTWVGLLALVPCVGFFMRIALGVKGNEWAWRNKKWKSIEHFRSAQLVWTIVGVCLLLLSVPIYAAVMFPVFARARENARRSACQSNMKQISLGMLQFSVDHNGKTPSGTTMASWKSALNPYTKSEVLYLCPSIKSGEESYVLNPNMADITLNDLADPASTPVFADAFTQRHLGGVNVAFADGHIKWYNDAVWQAQILPRMQSVPEVIR